MNTNPNHNNHNDNAANTAESKQATPDKVASHDNNDDEFVTNWDKVVDSFEHMDLSENLLRGVYAYGWQKPSDIQQRAILPTISGRDIIAQAQSGRGKTGAFTIASLQRVQLNNSQPQILILSPTRELARQTWNVLRALSSYIDNVSCHLCVGGTAVRDDIRALSKGQQIVVGTPGRVNAMIKDGYLQLKALQLFILDEADEMLSRGFKEQIYDCFAYLPSEVQVALFSATMPLEILQLTQRFMRDAVRILVREEELTLDGIKQFHVAVEREDYKLATLLDLYENVTINQMIIFVNTRRKVIWLSDKMRQHDFSVSSMHGDLAQKERELIIREFRSGSTRVLIATDILARGIDVQGVSLVLNYDLPQFKETYIHRIGRSGRFGRKGCAINFVPDEDEGKLRDLEKFYDTAICELPEDVAQVLP